MKYFRLFANCKIVRGAKRSTLCDLYKGRIKIIPTLLDEVLCKLQEATITDTKIHFESAYDEGIDLYLNDLISDDWGFYTEEPHLFPDMSLEFHSHSLILNSILDWDDNSDYDFSESLRELEELGCENIQIRYYGQDVDVFGHRLISMLKNYNFTYVEFYFREISLHNKDLIGEFINSFLIQKFVVFDCEKTEEMISKEDSNKNLLAQIVYTKSSLSEESCGVIDSKWFYANINFYTEGIDHNTCLNRKVSVSREGFLKNCPSMKNSYGHRSKLSFKELINMEQFNRYWSISKSKVSTCRDCEFRLVCPDCRVFIQDEKDIFSKPAKCKYDPYTSTWS